MLDKSFGVIYFHFNISSEKKLIKRVLKFPFFGSEEIVIERFISHYSPVLIIYVENFKFPFR